MTEVAIFLLVLVTSVPAMFLTLVYEHIKANRLARHQAAFDAACRIQAARINQLGREARGEA